MPQTARSARSTNSAQLRPHHVRTIALAGAVVGVVVLPIAAAQASPPAVNRDILNGSAGQGLNAAGVNAAGVNAAGAQADQTSTTPARSAGSGAQALAPEFCGAPVTAKVSGGMLHVQACVDQSAGSASARVYVANNTSADRVVAVNLARADGSVVQVQCTIAAEDPSGLCATAPTAISAGSGAFNAIAELAPQSGPVSAGVVHVESGLVAAQSAAQ